MAEKEAQTTSKKLSVFLENNKKVVVIVLALVICAIAAFIVGEVVGSSAKKKDISSIDAISFALTDKSAELETAELNAKIDSTLADLAKYTKKSGVTGVRANLLAAELSYQKEDYEAAAKFYEAAAAKSKKAYTAPIAYYNLASCYEKLNNLDAAAANYKKAGDNEDYILKNHAKFSYGRVLETQGKYAEAVAAYTELNDKDPDDNWAKLAKTRIISLKVEGKVE